MLELSNDNMKSQDVWVQGLPGFLDIIMLVTAPEPGFPAWADIRISEEHGFPQASASKTRSSSREVRIRVPDSCSVFSRGTLPQKRNDKSWHLAGGPGRPT